MSINLKKEFQPMKKSKKAGKKTGKKVNREPGVLPASSRNAEAAFELAQDSLAETISEAARETFSTVAKAEEERVFQTALAGALVKSGAFVEKISDIPGKVNSTGYDMQYLDFKGNGIAAFIEVKKAPDGEYNLAGLKAMLRPAQVQKRAVVEAYGSPLLRYYIVVFMPGDFIVQDITESE